jgi:Peptidase family M23
VVGFHPEKDHPRTRTVPKNFGTILGRSGVGTGPSPGVIAKLAAAFGAACVCAASLPFLMVPGAGGPDVAQAGPAACGDLGVILDTIRTVETGGNYETRIATATASGAYAFIDSSWQYFARQAGTDTSQYPSAWMAPPPQQDAAAAVYVNQLLRDHNDQIDVIPVGWYLPSALGHPELMDQVPYPEAGNNLTVRQYQLKWMNVYHQKLAAAAPGPDGINANCSTSVTADGQWALPAPRDALANAGIDGPHHDYPAVDLMMPEGTPVFAVTGGTVARTTHFPANLWRGGCNGNNPPAGCASCGMGVTIRTTDGTRFTYCHNSVLYVNDGDTITAGQHVADSGDTGFSGAPHLHLEVRVNNVQHCPQHLVRALYDNQPPPTPAALPTTGCFF